jgi:hypothetical protein
MLRTHRAVMGLLVAALVVLFSALVQRPAPRWVFVGSVVGFEPGEWIYVDSMDRGIALRETTAFVKSPADITPGVRVQVSGRRSIGERGLVADRVRVLDDAPSR